MKYEAPSGSEGECAKDVKRLGIHNSACDLDRAKFSGSPISESEFSHPPNQPMLPSRPTSWLWLLHYMACHRISERGAHPLDRVGPRQETRLLRHATRALARSSVGSGGACVPSRRSPRDVTGAVLSWESLRVYCDWLGALVVLSCLGHAATPRQPPRPDVFAKAADHRELRSRAVAASLLIRLPSRSSSRALSRV